MLIFVLISIDFIYEAPLRRCIYIASVLLVLWLRKGEGDWEGGGLYLMHLGPTSTMDDFKLLYLCSRRNIRKRFNELIIHLN